jgi:hypothetical protein
VRVSLFSTTQLAPKKLQSAPAEKTPLLQPLREFSHKKRAKFRIEILYSFEMCFSPNDLRRFPQLSFPGALLAP